MSGNEFMQFNNLTKESLLFDPFNLKGVSNKTNSITLLFDPFNLKGVSNKTNSITFANHSVINLFYLTFLSYIYD